MEFKTDPRVKMTLIISGPFGYDEVEDVPDSYKGLILPGRRFYPPVEIVGLEAPLGVKIRELSLEGYNLYGVIPLQINDGVAECIFDYFTQDV